MRNLSDATTLGRSIRKVVYRKAASGQRPLEFFLYRPTIEALGAPLVVSVHGIARNAAAHVYRLIANAEHFGLSVVAPLFEKQSYGQYQQLEDQHSGARSDQALINIIEAASEHIVAAYDKILLFGHSGGAQFAHRFAFVHPQRVASAVLVGAGWYTLPDPSQRYPYGLAAPVKGRLEFDATAWIRIPLHVMVGECDVERDGTVRQSALLDRQQGETRLERARRWVEAARKYRDLYEGAAPVTFDVLPGVGHSFVECVENAELAHRIFNYFAADLDLKPLRRPQGE